MKWYPQKIISFRLIICRAWVKLSNQPRSSTTCTLSWILRAPSSSSLRSLLLETGSVKSRRGPTWTWSFIMEEIQPETYSWKLNSITRMLMYVSCWRFSGLPFQGRNRSYLPQVRHSFDDLWNGYVRQYVSLSYSKNILSFSQPTSSNQMEMLHSRRSPSSQEQSLKSIRGLEAILFRSQDFTHRYSSSKLAWRAVEFAQLPRAWSVRVRLSEPIDLLIPSDEREFQVQYGNLTSAADVEKLQLLLKPLMLRRLKEDVEKSIPVKEETIVEVELTTIQKKWYRSILERNFSWLKQGPGKKTNMPNLINTMIELRKCCIHPFLLKGAEEAIYDEYKASSLEQHFQVLIQASGKMVLIDKLLKKLKDGGHKVLLFSQMTRCLDIIQDYLRGRNYGFERIDGSVRGDLRQAAIDRFCDPKSESFGTSLLLIWLYSTSSFLALYSCRRRRNQPHSCGYRYYFRQRLEPAKWSSGSSSLSSYWTKESGSDLSSRHSKHVRTWYAWQSEHEAWSRQGYSPAYGYEFGRRKWKWCTVLAEQTRSRRLAQEGCLRRIHGRWS